MTAPLNVGTLVGYLTLDDKGVDKGVRGATQKIQSFAKSGAQEGGKAGTAIGKAAGDKTASEFGKAESKLVQKTRSVFGTVGKVATGILGGLGIAQVLTKGWDRLTGIENAQAKLRGLGHDGEAVQRIMDNALAAVKGTAFGLGEAATTAAGAVAAGIQPGENLERVLKAVANSAAAAGVGMDEMGGIFNKVASLGKAQNDVLQQVANQGLPIYQELAKQFGVTADEVFKMATRGEIGFAQFEAAMKSASGTVADEMGKTTTGAISNLGAAAGRFGATILGEVQPAIKGLADFGITAFDGLGKAVGSTVDLVGQLPGPLKATAAAMAGLGIAQVTGALAKLSEWLLLARVRASELAHWSGPHGLGKSLGSLGKSLAKGGAIAGGLLIVSTALDAVQKQIHLTDDVIAQHEASVRSLADAYAQSGGEIDGTVRGRAWDDLRNNYEDLIAWAKENKIGLDQLVDAYLGVQNAETQRVRDAIAAGQEVAEARGGSTWERILFDMGEARSENAKFAEQLKNFLGVADEAAVATRDWAEATRDQATATDQAAAATERIIGPTVEEAAAVSAAADEKREMAAVLKNVEANADSYTDSWQRMGGVVTVTEASTVSGRSAIEQMSGAIKILSADSSEASTRLQLFTLRVDELAGRNVDLEQATKLLNDQVRAIKAGFKDATDATKGNIESLIRADGTIKTTTEAGSKLYESVTSYRQAYDTATTAAVQAAGGQKDVTASLKAGRAAADEARAKFLEQAAALKINKSDAEKLATAMGILEGKKLTPKTLGLYAQDNVSAKLDEIDRRKLNPKTVDVNFQVNQSAFDAARKKLNYPDAYPAHAAGGAIHGPGPKGVDSLLRWLAPGEHVLTDKEVDRMGGQGAVYAFRQALMSGGIPGLATGGALTAPTRSALTGLAAPQLGPTLSGVSRALEEYRALAAEAAAASKAASQAYSEQAKKAQQDARARLANYDEVRLAERARRNEANARLAEARKEQRRVLADSKATDAQKRAAAKRVADAEKAAAKAEADRVKKVRDTLRAANAANAADAKRVEQLGKEATAAEQRAKATAAANKQTSALQTAQTRLAGLWDTTTDQIQDATSALQGLRDASAQLSDSVSSRIIGDTSMLGMDVDGISGLIGGLRANLTAATQFDSAIQTLGKRGLDADVLTSLAAPGLAAAPLVHELAGASAAQIKQINDLQARIAKVASATGEFVAGHQYGGDIRTAQRELAAFEATRKELEKLLTSNAAQLSKAMEAGLKGMTVKVTMDGKQVDARIEKILSTQARSLASAR